MAHRGRQQSEADQLANLLTTRLGVKEQPSVMPGEEEVQEETRHKTGIGSTQKAFSKRSDNCDQGYGKRPLRTVVKGSG